MYIRVLELKGLDPARWGEQHGESLRDDVRALYRIRLDLMLHKTDLGSEASVLELARHHLPVLEQYDPALYAELYGIARGAALTAEQVLVVNHYTDLRDLSQRDLARLRGDPDGCSAMFAVTPAGRVLGQTWDMHGSAEPYAVLLKIPGLADGSIVDKASPAGIPEVGSTLVFSIAGCLGMTGMSSWGTALTINNLNSVDAGVGVAWPALVRRALRQRSARAALDTILSAPIGSGRHYIVADDSDAFGVETSGKKKKLIWQGERTPYFHTNHCIDPEMAPTCRILPGSTTLQRYHKLEALVGQAPANDARSMFEGFLSVVLPHADASPHDVATCGAVVMDITGRSVIACQGAPGPDADSTIIELRA